MKALRELISGTWSLVTGMWITLREFFKPTLTLHYPHETPVIPKRYRGHIELIWDPATTRANCTGCNLCAKACPSDCIVVTGTKLEGEKRRSVTKYILDYTKCSLCSACIEACPSDAIRHTGRYNIAAGSNIYNAMDLVERCLAQGGTIKPPPAPPAPAADPAAPLPSAPVPAPASS